MDEILVLFATVSELQARVEEAMKAGDDEGSQALLQELIPRIEPILSEIVPALTGRVLRDIDEGNLSRRERKALFSVHMGLRLEPVHVGLRALMNPQLVPWVRHEDEAPFVESFFEDGDDDIPLATYADYLDRKGEPEAAERLRRLSASERSTPAEVPAATEVAATVPVGAPAKTKT